MFSQTTEYSLRVVVYLAAQGERPAKSREIAAATHVPADYLAKVLQILSRGGLVKSQRGLYGGSVLTRAAHEITVHDVVQLVDPLPRIHTCPLNLPAHGVTLCPLHRQIDDAMAMVEETLKNAPISAMLRPDSSGGHPESKGEVAWDKEAAAEARISEAALVKNFPRRKKPAK
jgi:Rrf2 family protein